MIIELSIPANELDLLNMPEHAACLSDLLRAHRSGHHLVVIERGLAEILNQYVAGNPLVAATLARIGTNYTQTADLLRRASIRIVINSILGDGFKRQQSAIFTSLLEVSRPYFLDRTVLIVEDTNCDGRFYETLLSVARGVEKTPPVKWEVAHGGGSRTSVVLTDKINDRRLACVVLDSDRKSPVAPSSQALKDIESIIIEKNWPFAFALVAPCHEIENMVPLSVVLRVPALSTRIATASFLSSVERRENALGIPDDQRFWLFFDSKNGLSDETRAKMKEADLFWLDKRINDCGHNSNLNKHDGFSGNMIEQIIDSNFLVSELRKAIQTRSWWNVFGAHITRVAWLCAAEPRQFA